LLPISRRRTVAAGALLSVVALLGVACSSSKDSTGTTNTSGAASSNFDYSGLSGTLNGSGSTFQKTFDEAAIAGFADVAPDVTVNYAGGGSGQGKTDLANQVVQWAGTDSLIKDADLPTFKGGTVLYFPTVAAPITVSYNLSGVSKLQLSQNTLAKIFASKITTWNDAAIAADNPGVDLPSTPITVVHRSDGSGTTNQFTKFLDTVDKTDWTLGTGDTVNWATTTQAGKGNAGVAQIIQATAGAVGYVDFADANASKLVFASIKNQSGAYVAPSLAAASAALAGGQVAANLTVNALNASGADAYPITAATYVIAYQNQPDTKIGNALKGWLNYLLTDAQALAPDTDFAPLPSSLQQQALTQLGTMTIG
jgi:phosphate transport system substrate-binding protein